MFGIVERMAKPKAMRADDLEKIFQGFFGGGASTSSGVAVSENTAMRQATVYGCVNVLSRTLGQLPCSLYRQDGRNKVKAGDKREHQLIHTRPNEWMTPSEFKNMMMNHLALRGNFYGFKVRKTNGEVIEILPLAPGIVQKVEQNKDWSLAYHCRMPDGTPRIFPGSDMVHVKGMVVNGFLGVSPITYIRESVGLGLAAEEFGARYFGSGTHPGIIVEHPGKLSDTADKNLRDSLSGNYSGLGKSHRLMVLEEGMKAQKITIDPKDAQFLELRQYQRSEIVDIFFATPLSLMAKGDAPPTYASSEQFSIGFVVYALMPWLVSIEEAFNRDLIQAADRANHYFKFVPQGLLRGSFKEQMEAFATAIDKEIMNPNECRDLLDMNPYDGGDEYRTRTSTVNDPGKDASGNTAPGEKS